MAVAGMLVATMVSGCALFGGSQSAAASKATDKALTIDERAAKIVAGMSDSQKIGQLMMIGIKGPTLDKDATYMLNEYKYGNVILFDRNLTSTDQTKELNGAIKKQIEKNTGVSPFIAVDQEGGLVTRMRSYFPDIPSEEAIGKQDPSLAKKWAVTTGTELKKMGFTVDFAPVVDIGSARGRAYSSDPDRVISFAEQACAGYKESGVWCSLKHFPGIGRAKVDPHIDGTSVDMNRDQLEQADLKPFRELIKKVDNNDVFVMVSNVTYPQLVVSILLVFPAKS